MVARIDSMREGYRMIAGDPTLIDAIRIRLSARTPSAPKLTDCGSRLCRIADAESDGDGRDDYVYSDGPVDESCRAHHFFLENLAVSIAPVSGSRGRLTND